MFLVNAQQKHLIVGTYTNENSQGIYVYNFNTNTANSKLISVTKSSNPSFLAVSPNAKFVYAVNENADTVSNIITGQVSSYTYKNGKLKLLNIQPSAGKHPCYVTVNKTGKWVIVANYSSGSIVVFKVNKNGLLDTINQLITHTGTGPNADRQQASHVHSTNFSANNKLLYVADLGIDKIMIYNFNEQTGKLTYKTSTTVAAGSGPRHFTISKSGKFAYLVEELTGTVSTYSINKNGSLQFLQRISSLPKNFTGSISSADIHIEPNGKYLYVSNRANTNALSIFIIDSVKGILKLIGSQITNGLTPRNFTIDPSGKYLLVANQNSNSIHIFLIDTATGNLKDMHKKITTPNPVCLQWIN